MNRVVRIALAIALAATTTGLSLAAPAPPTSAGPKDCSTDPTACTYQSNLSYSVGTVDLTSLSDPDRNNYPVPVLVRYPIGARGPRPVVIWHHGGSAAMSGRTRSAEWGDLLAAAGYVVIHPARISVAAPTTAEMDECTLNGFGADALTCGDFLAQHRYGPMTTAFLISKFADIEAADPALTGMLSRTVIAVAGFSSGTTSALVNSGAWQQWTTENYDEPIPEPVAFFAAGPQGPMYAGFGSGFHSPGAGGWAEHSYAGVDRPFMFMTGVGDETGEPPETRVTGFLTSKAGDKYLVWNTKYEAKHETMNLHDCTGTVPANHCEWLESAGLAFFDTYLRNRPKAARWLHGDAMATLTSGEIELHRR